jgi:alpha-glucoside transport system substrate-binding protein
MIVFTILFAACAPSQSPQVVDVPVDEDSTIEEPPPTSTVSLSIIGSWRASESEAFEYVLDGFREATGIQVNYEGMEEVVGPLATRIAANSPPDLAILPVANGLFSFIEQNALVPLNFFQDEIEANFDQGWIDQFSLNGNIYGIPTRADVSNLLFFNPEVIGENVPNSWSEFIAYCDLVISEGEKCTAGLGRDSWTISILFENIYLSAFGLDKYNDLLTGDIPWTDETVVEAMNRLLVFYGDEYAVGGKEGVLGTGLVDGIALVFSTTPEAKFVALPSWATGIAINAVNEDLVEGESIEYVMFPGETAGQGAIIAASDVAVLLVDSPEGRQLIRYLSGAEGQGRFTPNGYTVANKNVDPALYSGLATRSASLLVNSEVGPSSGIVVGTEFRNLYIEAIAAAILDPSSLEFLLEDLQMAYENRN